MVVLRNSLFAAFLLSGCTFASEPFSLEVENNLIKCLQVSQHKTYMLENVPFTEIRFNEVQSTAECGCKSALNTFRSYYVASEYKSLLMEGKFSVVKNKIIKLPIATDIKLIGKDPVLLVLSCALPD